MPESQNITPEKEALIKENAVEIFTVLKLLVNELHYHSLTDEGRALLFRANAVIKKATLK